jgi:outer membrane immunogenic protein
MDPWTGLYGGANVGYSWGPWTSNNPTGAALFFNGTTLVNDASPHVNGMIGGVQLGYNWRLQSNWIAGLEADLQWSGEKDSNGGSLTLLNAIIVDNRFVLTGATANDWKMKWFSTFRGRVGFTTADQWMFYGTGGLALINAKFSNTTTATLTRTTLGGALVSQTSASVANSESKTKLGFAIGAGVEKKLTADWSTRLEYLYIDGGSYTFLSGTGADTSVRIRDHIVRVGLNYAFTH